MGFQNPQAARTAFGQAGSACQVGPTWQGAHIARNSPKALPAFLLLLSERARLAFSKMLWLLEWRGCQTAMISCWMPR
jgi:hypothetical protein